MLQIPLLRLPPRLRACKDNWHLCADNSEMANNYSGWIHAQNACEEGATALAKYGTPAWPHSWMPNFNTFRNGSDYKETGQAVLVERNAQFQNGFGAMMHSTVTCIYDLAARKVIDVTIEPH
jgi:hypothetical protein